jgi:Rieske Fe-S protein
MLDFFPKISYMPSNNRKTNTRSKTKSKSNSNRKSKSKSNNNRNSNKTRKSNSSLKCPPNMTPINTNNELLCVGRCPHSGGPIYYNPKLDKLVCKWHGSQFTKKGKVLVPPATSNLNVKKLK